MEMTNKSKLCKRIKDTVSNNSMLKCHFNLTMCINATVAKRYFSVDALCLLLSPIFQLLMETEDQSYAPVLKPEENPLADPVFSGKRP